MDVLGGNFIICVVYIYGKTMLMCLRNNIFYCIQCGKFTFAIFMAGNWIVIIHCNFYPNEFALRFSLNTYLLKIIWVLRGSPFGELHLLLFHYFLQISRIILLILQFNCWIYWSSFMFWRIFVKNSTISSNHVKVKFHKKYWTIFYYF